MLVLALQFSRCDVTLAELDHEGRLDAAASLRNDSLKTEEKTVATDVRANERDRIPAIDDRCDDSPPVHQQVCLAPGSNVCRSSSGEALLRKEVIQPHLPVRLPCYDFTPIATPTFERSVPKGFSHVLRVLATFVV